MKLKKWWKEKIEKVGNWATDPYPWYVSNADAYVGSFFSGAGVYFYAWMIVVTIYCLLTGKKLGFIKK